MIYHYTDANALSGIFKKDNLCIWATRYDKLNDPLEFKWAEKHILPEIEKLSDKNKRTFDKEHRVYPYIISFCNYSDNLTMWRLYGKDGLGFQLGLDCSIIEKETQKNCLAQNDTQIGNKMPEDKKLTPDYFMMCIYAKEDDLQEKIKCGWNIFQKCHNSDTNNDLLDMCAFIKRNDYKIEREVRYVRPNYNIAHFTKDNYETVNWEQDVRNVKYRPRGNEFIPYQEVLFPKEALKEIVVGYGYDLDDATEYLKYLLSESQYDISKIEIKQSKFINK